MRFQHRTFMDLATKVNILHQRISKEKALYLEKRRSLLNDERNVFEVTKREEKSWCLKD